jgi:hypothetical protein
LLAGMLGTVWRHLQVAGHDLVIRRMGFGNCQDE